MKKLLSLIALTVALNASAQTNTDTNAAPTVQSGAQMILDAVKSGQTNWSVATYGLYAPSLSHKYGAGIGYFYPLSEYFLTGVRVDYVDGDFWMPSGNATLQLPLKITSWLTVTPFTYAGIGVPVSGGTVGSVTIPGSTPRDNNGQATAILGYGGAVHIYSTSDKKWNVSAVMDQERWSGFPGLQYRFGLLLNRKF